MNNSNHYFSADPKSEIILHQINYSAGARDFTFTSASGVFSKSAVDDGSDALIRTILAHRQSAGILLDLGCGYGVIGISLSSLLGCRAVLCDINPRAVELAGQNCRANGADARAVLSDGFSEIEGCFDIIATNPPIRAGKDVFFGWFEQAPGYLVQGGSFWCVIRKKQGAPSAREKLAEVFGNCEIMNRDKGYYVLMSRKG